jgi:hypothetical protein
MHGAAPSTPRQRRTNNIFLIVLLMSLLRMAFRQLRSFIGFSHRKGARVRRPAATWRKLAVAEHVTGSGRFIECGLD